MYCHSTQGIPGEGGAPGAAGPRVSFPYLYLQSLSQFIHEEHNNESAELFSCMKTSVLSSQLYFSSQK